MLDPVGLSTEKVRPIVLGITGGSVLHTERVSKATIYLRSLPPVWPKAVLCYSELLRHFIYGVYLMNLSSRSQYILSVFVLRNGLVGSTRLEHQHPLAARTKKHGTGRLNPT